MLGVAGQKQLLDHVQREQRSHAVVRKTLGKLGRSENRETGRMPAEPPPMQVLSPADRRLPQDAANLSVARIRPSRTPGSLNRCPPSGMMLSSTSGHACLSRHAATGGVQVSCRPWTMTPGMPFSLFASRSSWPSSSHPLFGHVMVLDPSDGDGDFGAGEMLDRRGAGQQRDDVALPFAPRLGGARAARPCRCWSGACDRLRRDRRARPPGLARGIRRTCQDRSAKRRLPCTSSRSHIGRTGRCRAAPAR